MASKKMANRGSNISELSNLNNAPDDARAKALRRTQLVYSLNVGRCTTPEELQDRFHQLFNLCAENNFIPNIEMLALCSGFDRRTLFQIEKGEIYKGTTMADVVKTAKEYIGTLEATLAVDGDINSTVYIFRAKNYQGMVDKQEMVVTPNTGISAPANAQSVIDNVPELDD